jgi:LmbE family N-acetylglucosaminyl deacetylase
MSVTPPLPRRQRTGPPIRELPGWTAVLAVVAHPDDESFGLGAVLDAFARAGSRVSVLCFTHGESSSLHGVPGDLGTLRAVELSTAAAALGLVSATLGEHPDGGLAGEPRAQLAGEVVRVATASGAEGLVVFDPGGVTGHPDHGAASRAALDAAHSLALPVLAWTLPAHVADQLNAELGTRFAGHPPSGIDLAVPVRRDRQLAASRAHASQALPTSVLWRRLALLGDTEHLRWLRRPGDRSG